MCSRDFSSKRKPLCASCAQATLYGPRIQSVTALLDREKQHTHAEAIVRPGNDGVIAALPPDADLEAITAGVSKHRSNRWREEQQRIEARISDITEKADELRRLIEDYRERMARQKEVHARRRSDVAAERKQLDKLKPRILDPVQASALKASHRLEKVHNRTADARALLCREAASLAGLERRLSDDGRARYWLGGVPIPDLRELTGKNTLDLMALEGGGQSSAQAHELISAGLDNVCRLLGNCCHYLSVRLPAEILLPHNDFLHAAVVPMTSSYKLNDPQYSGMASSHHPSLAASRRLEGEAQQKAPARPRPLYLESALAQLIKEDSKTFHLFTEGAIWLAYDIAWLCRSQGIDSINTFEDVCAIGRNLYRLLLTQERPPASRTVSSAQTQTERPKPAPVPARLGVYSHGSAQLSLAGVEGAELFRNWRIPTHARLVDKLKSYLLTEISGLEWDILSDKEWDEEREDEVAVLVGGERRSLDRQGPAMSVMTVVPHSEQDGGIDASRAKGTSGWIRVRDRGGDG